MTPQEAIKTFKTVVVYAPEKYENKYYKAIMLAIEALEKQIPQKPKSVTDPMFGDLTLTCPRCGNVNLANPFKRNGYDYCPDCGQALDWSDN